MRQHRLFLAVLISSAAMVSLSAVARPAAGAETDYAAWAYAGASADTGVKPAAPKATKPQRPYVDSEEGSRAVSPATPTPRPVAPARTPEAAAASQTAIPPEAMAGSYGAATGPATAVPNMIGDSYDGSIGGFGGMKFTSSSLGISEASVGLAGGSRRFKIAEDESPIPTDRVIFDYNHFQNPLVDINGTTRNLDRFTFGLEKTFGDGLWSLEFRVPFATDYNSTQSTVGGPLSATEFGDMALVARRALISREHFVLAAGLGMVFPTGPDWKITDATGTVVNVWNEAVHLDPFVGAAWCPGDRLFFLFFAQLDFDTHGDTVLARSMGGTLDKVDVFHEQNLVMLDFNMGYWLYRNPCACRLTGIAPIVEVHYTSTLQDMDSVTVAYPYPYPFTIGPPTGTTGRRDILDLTAGIHFQIGSCSTFRVAAVVPLTTGENREFDCEVLAQFNRWF